MKSIIKKSDIEKSIIVNTASTLCPMVLNFTKEKGHQNINFTGLGHYMNAGNESDTTLIIKDQGDFEGLNIKEQCRICDLCEEYPKLNESFKELGITIHE